MKKLISILMSFSAFSLSAHATSEVGPLSTLNEKNANLSRYQVLKNLFDTATTPARSTTLTSTGDFSGAKVIKYDDKHFANRCVFAYEAAPDALIAAQLLAIVKTVPAAGPLFPKAEKTTRALLLATPFSLPVDDLNGMVTHVSEENHDDVTIEKISKYAKGALMNPVATELQIKKSGDLIAFRYVYKMDPKKSVVSSGPYNDQPDYTDIPATGPNDFTPQASYCADDYGYSNGCWYNGYNNRGSYQYWYYNGSYSYYPFYNYWQTYAYNNYNYGCSVGSPSAPYFYHSASNDSAYSSYAGYGNSPGLQVTTYAWMDAYGYCYAK